MILASGATRWGPTPAVLLFWGNPAHAAARIVFEELEIEAPVDQLFEAVARELGVHGEGAGHAVGAQTGDAAAEPAGAVEAAAGHAGEARTGDAAAEPAAGAGRILALDPGSLLTLQWLMPPELTAIARHRTVLTLTFEPTGRGSTRLSLTHSGFGKGQAWDQALAFYTRAWPQALAAMKTALEAEASRPH